MGALLALLSGGTIVLNRTLNAEAGKRIGLTQSTVFNYITGLAASLVVLLVSREPFIWPPAGSFHLYLGGAIGVVVVTLSSYSAPMLSSFLMTLLVCVSQFAAGVVIDALNGVNMSPLRLVGGLIVLCGLVLYVLAERREDKEEQS